jgi:Baseplate J-like protein
VSPLAPLQLDDVGFRELADAAIERIPAESGGRWTLHSPVDPGITILELLAYLLDQRIWWLDQLSDSAVRGMLRLLGEVPERACPAATVLGLDRTSAGAATEVPAGTQMLVQASDPEIAFTIAHRVLLLPIASVGLTVDGQPRTEDLDRGRGVELLPAGGGPGEARLLLRTDGPLPTGSDGRAGLLLRLRTQTLGPQWLADEDDPRVGPPAELTWGYGDRTFPAGALLDGTGGLRRSGIVRFHVPADWTPDAPPESGGRAEYSLWARAERAAHTAPPRLLAAVPNAVVAHHRARVRPDEDALEQQVRDWLPLPGRVLDLGAPGLVLDGRRAVRLSLRERDGRWRRWHATADLAFHGPADRVFVVNREAGTLEFGDGVTGRVPALHDQPPRVRLTHLAGGGPSGNFGIVDWEARRGPLTARSAEEAAGGREPETIAAARERVGAALARRERAVTDDDHETIAESTPGVEVRRAHAAVGFHPAHPCTLVPGAVTVFVVPDAPRGEAGDGTFVAAPVPDPGLLAAVAARLENARLLGSELFVEPPRYRPARLLVTISTPAPDAGLRKAIEADLREYLDPLVGGDDRDGWPFGEPLRPSALLRRAQAVAGNSAQIASVAVGLDGAEPDRRCEDVAIGPHDLVVADAVELRGDVPVDVEGGLR